MFEKFRQRSHELENIDKGTYTPAEYEGCLVELRRVNEWLGDAKVLRESLFAEIERAGLRSFSVLDVGAGSGELLRVTARWARETKRAASLVGLELNERSAAAILEESRDFPEISSLQANGLVLPFPDRCFDYAIQSLTLHHFDDAGAVSVIRECALNRSRLAACMKDARHRLTSKILEKSAERPKCLKAWLSLAEPSSCKIRWRYRTYHAPWCSYIQPF